MFCSKCGQKNNDEASFCPRCGHQLRIATFAPNIESEVLPISIAVYKNISLTKTAPYVLRLDWFNCGLIKIEPNVFDQIIQFTVLEKQKTQAFREFAKNLRSKPLELLVIDFPGSIEFATAHIQSLHIETFYDANFHRNMAYDRFTLVTSEGKHKGSIDCDSDISSFKPTLKRLLQNRFSAHETVHSFDT